MHIDKGLKNNNATSRANKKHDDTRSHTRKRRDVVKSSGEKRPKNNSGDLRGLCFVLCVIALFIGLILRLVTDDGQSTTVSSSRSSFPDKIPSTLSLLEEGNDNIRKPKKFQTPREKLEAERKERQLLEYGTSLTSASTIPPTHEISRPGLPASFCQFDQDLPVGDTRVHLSWVVREATRLFLEAIGVIILILMTDLGMDDKTCELVLGTIVVFAALYLITISGLIGGTIIRLLLDAAGGVALILCSIYWKSFREFVLETLAENSDITVDQAP
eukprot:CAMPEP_0185753010 /NCGR_PEP_ID=MMETSP1174-20130828/11768_1 /TAXON_ID=35687 /ORGANISM="Dictyocha speculum, Strain CCMP1381" /LENGTH=272 /DNA_ID=CAMNT_0028430687 /DNA_START=146 /DNA_END=964 /DNA_ORIENTATION=+